MKLAGRFITLEGLDGCGKSTQLALLAEYLRGRGLETTATEEPGGTAAGRQIRELVLKASAEPLTAPAELALMFAARAQHIEQVILPALRSGAVVLCDRFTDSTVAYQGYGRGISLEVIRALEQALCQGLRPDLTLLLDVDPETAARRTGGRNQSARQQPTRFEKEGLEFFERVRQGYRALARDEPHRVRLLNGMEPIAQVEEAVRRAVEEFLRRATPGSSHGV